MVSCWKRADTYLIQWRRNIGFSEPKENDNNKENMLYNNFSRATFLFDLNFYIVKRKFQVTDH